MKFNNYLGMRDGLARSSSRIINKSSKIDPVLKKNDSNENSEPKPIRLTIRYNKYLKLPRRTKTIFPSKNISSIKNLQKKNIFLSFCLSILIISGSYYEAQSLYYNNYVLTSDLNMLRIILSGLAGVQILLVIIYYYNKLRIKISYKEISKYSWIHQNSNDLTKLLMELFVCCIVIPPYITYQTTIDQISVDATLSIDDMILGLTFLRTYQVFKLYFEFSAYNTLRSRFFCDIQSVESQFVFTIKSCIQESPWISIFVLFGMSLGVSGLVLKIYEQSVSDSSLSYVWNNFWFISVTQSTIGYGDLVPSTHLGITVAVFCALIGVTLYSYIVVIARNSTKLSSNELKLYYEIKYKSHGLPRLKKIGIVLIQRWWRLLMKRQIRANKVIHLFRYKTQLQRFTLNRLIQINEKAPTLNEEVEKTSKSVTSIFEKIDKHLNSTESSELLSLKYLNLNFSTKTKINELKHSLKYAYFADEEDMNHLNVRKNSAASSRASMKKSSILAVKKLLSSKVAKTPSRTNLMVQLSDEDFFSSEKGSTTNNVLNK